jgi:hypothetical protein
MQNSKEHNVSETDLLPSPREGVGDIYTVEAVRRSKSQSLDLVRRNIKSENLLVATVIYHRQKHLASSSSKHCLNSFKQSTLLQGRNNPALTANFGGGFREDSPKHETRSYGVST